jgi:hypothetical protein
MAATTKTPTPTEVDEGFNTTEITVKGKSYSFRELSAEEYDECVELASHGEGDDKTLDTVQMLRWMIVKGSVDPKLNPAQLGKLPFSATTKISRAVNDLHFAPDEDLAIKACTNEECKWSEGGVSKLPADAKFCSNCGKEQVLETNDDGGEKIPNA